MVDFVSQSEQDTDRLGRIVGRHIDDGIVIALVGTLGAGKTRFVRAIGAAWGVEGDLIVSPTFTLCAIHDSGAKKFFHIDTYRLEDDDQWLELEFDEAIDDGNIVLIEWADRFAHLLPQDRLQIEISIEDADQRRFSISSGGEKSAALLAVIAADRQFQS